MMHGCSLVQFSCFLKQLISSLSDFTWSVRTRLRFNESDARCTTWFSCYLPVFILIHLGFLMFLLFFSSFFSLRCRIMGFFVFISASISHQIYISSYSGSYPGLPASYVVYILFFLFTSRAYTRAASSHENGLTVVSHGPFCTKYKS